MFNPKWADVRPDGHYVYIHRKSSDGSPFYVGKGSGKRAWFSKAGRSRYWNNVASKHGVTVEIYKDNLSERDALELEVILIKELRDKGESLVNLTDGGDGVNGYVPTQETIDLIRSTRIKKPVYCSNGMSFDSSGDASRWLRSLVDTCDPSGIRLCAKGKLKSYKGFAWSFTGVPNAPEFSGVDAINNGRNGRKRVVYCSNGLVFNSVMEAALWINPINPKAASDGISFQLKGKGVYCGFGWSLDSSSIPDPYDTREVQLRNILPRYKKVRVRGGLVVFKTIDDALISIGAEVNAKNREAIRVSARSENKLSFGDKWEYVE